MAEDPKKKSEEIKNAFEDLSDVIKDLEKDLLKTFDYKRIDKFVDSLTESVKEFDKVSTYTEDIQKNLIGVDKSVTGLSKTFGSLKSNVDNVFKSIPTTLNISSQISVNTDLLKAELKSLQNIQSDIKYTVQDIELPNIEDINASIKYNIDPIELPEIEDIDANIKYNVQDAVIPEVNDIEKTIKYNIQEPVLPQVNDVNANIKFNVQPIDLPKIDDIEKSIKYNVQDIQLPEISDIEKSIKYNVQTIEIPEVKNINALINYSLGTVPDEPKVNDINKKIFYDLETISTPKIEDIEKTIKYNVQDINIPKVEDIQANIKYNVQDIEIPKIKDINANVKYNVAPIEIPVVEDINALIKYDTQIPDTFKVENVNALVNYSLGNLPEQPKVNDINASINYQVNIPEQPTVEDINALIKYNVQLIDQPNIEDIQSNIKYNVQDIQIPKVEDINASIKFNTESIDLPKVDDIILNVKLNTESLSDLGKISDIELTAQISSVDATLIDKTIYDKYTPVIISSIIDAPDTSLVDKANKKVKVQEPKKVAETIQPGPIVPDFTDNLTVINDSVKATKNLGKETAAWVSTSEEWSKVAEENNKNQKSNADETSKITNKAAKEAEHQAKILKDQLDLQYKNKIITKEQYDAGIASAKALQDKSKELSKNLNLEEKLNDLNKEYYAAQAIGLGPLYKQQYIRESIAKATGRINELGKDQIDINKFIENSDGSHKQSLERISDIMDEMVSAEQTLAEKRREAADSSRTLGTSEYSRVDVSKQIYDAKARELMLATELNNLATDKNITDEVERKAKENLIKSQQKLNQAQLAELGILDQQSKTYDKISKKAGALADTLTTPIDKIFGLAPSGLSSFLGLDRVKEEFKEKVTKSIADGFASSSNSAIGFFKGMTAGIGQTLAGLARMLPMILAIGAAMAAIAVVGMLAKVFIDADKAVVQLAKDLGISKQEAIGVKDAAVSMAQEMNVLGVTSNEVTAQMTELKKATGLNFGLLAQTNDKAKEFLETATLVTHAFGLTADETVNLTRAAAMAGGSLEDMVNVAGALGDELVSTTDIMKDIVKLSARALENFAKTPATLAAAAKQARMMGTSLDQVNQNMEQSLDLFGSMENSLYASLYLGRSLDTSMLSYYAHQKDGVNYLKEQKRLLPSLEEYTKLGAIGAKKLAAALGMSEDQLSQMMAQKKLLAQMGISETAMEEKMQKLMSGELKMADELSKISDESARAQFKQLVMERQRQSMSDKMSATMQKLTDTLYKLVEPLIEPLNQMLDSILDSDGAAGNLTDTIKGVATTIMGIARTALPIISGLFNGIASTVGFIARIFNGIVDAISSAKTFLFGASDATDGMANTAKKVEDSMGVIKGIATAIGVIIGLWFAKKMVTGAINLFSSIKGGAQNISKTLTTGATGFFDTFKKTEGGPMKKLTKSIGSLFGKKLEVETPEVPETKSDADIKVKVTAFDTTLIQQELEKYKTLEIQATINKEKSASPETPKESNAPAINTKEMEKSAEKTKSISQKITSGFKSFNKSLNSVFKGIGDTLKNIFNFIRDTLKTGMDFISNVFDDVLQTVVKLSKSVGTAFEGILDVIQSALGKVIDVIDNVGTKLLTAVDKLLVGLKKTLLRSVQVVQKVGSKVIKTFKTLLVDLIDLFKTVGKDLINAVGEIITESAKLIQTSGPALINAIGAILGSTAQIVGSVGTEIVNALGAIGTAVVEQVMAVVNTLLDGLGEAAGKLPGIMNSLGSAIGSFFEGITPGLVAFGEAMAAPTPFGVPVGLILVGMALGFATAARIAAPAISALGTMFKGLGEGLRAATPAIEAMGKIVIAVFQGMGTVVESIGKAIGTVITSVADSINKIGNVNAVSILAVAAALPILAAGLLALTAGDIISGITSFFTGGPIETLNELASVDYKAMQGVANGVKQLASSLAEFNNIDLSNIQNSSELIVDFSDNLADIDYDDIDSLAESIERLGASYGVLSASIGKITAESIQKVKDLAAATGADTSSGILSSITSSISGAIEKVKTGFSSVTGGITKSLTSGFDAAYTAVSDWFGQSPSKVGDSIKKGISSVSGGIGESLSKPFKGEGIKSVLSFGKTATESIDSVSSSISNVTGTVSGTIDTIGKVAKTAGEVKGLLGGMGGGVATPNVAVGNISGLEELDKLKSVDVKGINDSISSLNQLNISSLGDIFEALGDALDELNVAQLKEFSSLAEMNLSGAGIALQQGMGVLVESLQQISNQQLLQLERSFDLIEDAFDELDVEGIKEFSSLASTDLRKAGRTFAKGIISLSDPISKISRNELLKLETSFDLIEDAFAELNIEDIQAFATLADTGLKRAGKSFSKAITSLSDEIGSIDYGTLLSLETSFDLIEDAFAELNIDDIQAFASLAGNVLPAAASAFSEAINSLISGISSSVQGDALNQLETNFDLIEDAFDELDFSDIERFAELSKTSLSDAASSFIEGITKLSAIPVMDFTNFEKTIESLNDAVKDNMTVFTAMQNLGKLAETSLGDAADNLKNGISSLASIAQGTDLGPFKKSLATMNEAFKVLDWKMLEQFGKLAESKLATAGFRLVDGIHSLSYVANVDLTPMKNALKQVNEAFSQLDWSAVQSFASLAEAKLVAAAGSLIDGINELAKVKEEINLDAVEESLNNLNDVLGQMDWENIDSFAKLADAKLVGAATRLIDGINTLANGIQNEIDLTAVEDTLSNLDEAFSAADWSSIETFASLADKNLQTAAFRLIDGVNALYNGLSQEVDMTALGNTLASLNVAFKAIEWKNVDSFASLADKKLVGAATQLSEGIGALSKIGSQQITIDTKTLGSVAELGKAVATISGVDPKKIDEMATAVNNLATSISSLASAMQSINEGDIGKIKQIAEALPTEDPGVLDKIGGIFSGMFSSDEEDVATSQPAVTPISPIAQAGLTVAANQTTPGGAIAAGAPPPQTNSPELKAINETLKAILQAIDQPTNITIDGRTITSLEKNLNARRSYSVGPMSRS